MFTYSKEDEISTLYKELEKYKNVGNESTVEELLANISISKEDTIKRIEELLEAHFVDKANELKAYHMHINNERTAEARIKYKPLIEEYQRCIARAVEIGENNIIEAYFNLNDYTEHKNIRGVIKKHLHMANVGLERINRQTT